MEDLNIQYTDALSITPVETELLETVTTDYKDLKKEELIKIIESKDIAYDNLAAQLDREKEANKLALENMDAHYKGHIRNLDALIKFHEDQLNLIKNIVVIGKRGE